MSLENAPVESPTPLAHLTYDCSVLTPAQAADATAPLFAVQSTDAGNSQPAHTCLLDWSGHLQLQMNGYLPRLASPNGRLYATSLSGTITDLKAYTLLDSAGSVVGRTGGVAVGEIMWTDRSDGVCFISSSAPDLSTDAQATLWLQPAGGSARLVATVGTIQKSRMLPTASSDLVPSSSIPDVPLLLGCSTDADRALVGDPLTGMLGLYRLSDGSLISQTRYPTRAAQGFFGPSFATHFVVSHDCRYLVTMPPRQRQQPSVVGPSTIHDLSTGSVVATLQDPVVGLNWDGTRAVLVSTAAPHEGYLLDWRSSTVISRLEFGAGEVRAEPGGPGLAIAVSSTRNQLGVDVYMVDGSGKAFEVARSVDIAAAGPTDS